MEISPSPSEVIPPAKPYFPRSDIETIKENVEKILSSGRLTLGEYTREFEGQFAKLAGVKYAVAVNSGTSALEISLRCQGLKHRDEVILPTNTFAATGATVVFAGGKPVLADVSKEAMTIDSSTVRKSMSRRTKGVIAVHIGGLICPDIFAIKEFCQEKDLFLIEDAAHAHGSKIDGKTAGSLGSAGCFSFYPTKIITSGEGGIITTDNDGIAKTAMILRDQGKKSFNSNTIVRLGYNWRLPEICAAIGVTQLRRLDEFIQSRNAIAKLYDAGFGELGARLVVTPLNQVNNYYKYTYFLPKAQNRDRFKALCREKGVAYGGEVYWPPLHLQPAFREFRSKHTGYNVAENWGRRMVCPPIFSQMTFEQGQRVIDVAREVISKVQRQVT